MPRRHNTPSTLFLLLVGCVLSLVGPREAAARQAPRSPLPRLQLPILVDGHPDTSVSVRMAMRRLLALSSSCFGDDPLRAGPINFQLSLTLRPDGHVAEARAVGPLSRPSVRCVERQAASVAFPPGAGRTIRARFRTE